MANLLVGAAAAGAVVAAGAGLLHAMSNQVALDRPRPSTTCLRLSRPRGAFSRYDDAFSSSMFLSLLLHVVFDGQFENVDRRAAQAHLTLLVCDINAPVLREFDRHVGWQVASVHHPVRAEQVHHSFDFSSRTPGGLQIHVGAL